MKMEKQERVKKDQRKSYEGVLATVCIECDKASYLNQFDTRMGNKIKWSRDLKMLMVSLV